MSNSDVRAKRLTGTGAAGTGRARLRQVQVLTIVDLDFTQSQTHSVNIPDEGVLFSTDIHVTTLTNISALTIFHS